MMRAAFVNRVRCPTSSPERLTRPWTRRYAKPSQFLASQPSSDLGEPHSNDTSWGRGNGFVKKDRQRVASVPFAVRNRSATGPLTKPQTSKDSSRHDATGSTTAPSSQASTSDTIDNAPLAVEGPLSPLETSLRTFFSLAHVDTPKKGTPNSTPSQYAWAKRIRRREKVRVQLASIPDNASRAAAEANFVDWASKYDGLVYHAKPSSLEWLEAGSWLYKLESPSAMSDAWLSLDEESRKQRWNDTMLATMYFAPDKVASVLDATMYPLPPSYALYDVLVFLAQRQHGRFFETTQQRVASANQMLQFVEKALDSLSVGPSFATGRLFGLLARYLPCDHVSELYDMLRRSGLDLEHETMASFATRLSKEDRYKRKALNIVIELLGMDGRNARLGAVITTLLTYRASHDTGSQPEQSLSPAEALQTLVEHQYVPNLINLTAGLDALCQYGEFEEAARLALLFSEEGVKLDGKLADKLLNGARASLQAGNVRKAIEVAKVTSMTYVNVLDHGLRSLLHFGAVDSLRQEPRRGPWILPLFLPMLRIYERKFKMEPLQRWLPDSLPLVLMHGHGHQDPSGSSSWSLFNALVPVIEDLFSASTQEKIAPSVSTAATMLQAYIRGLRDPAEVLKYYQFFKQRLEGDKRRGPFRRLIEKKHSLIHDTFIRTMMERRDLTRAALQVFGDMLQSHLLRSKAKSSRETEPDGATVDERLLAHPSPSLITFTIVIGGLMARGNTTLAEQLLQVMHEHGVDPDLPLWNTVIKGYASAQDISSTVSALQRMEAGGFQMNDRTLKAFAKLENQKEAMEAMERIIKENMERVVDDQVNTHADELGV